MIAQPRHREVTQYTLKIFYDGGTCIYKVFRKDFWWHLRTRFMGEFLCDGGMTVICIVPVNQTRHKIDSKISL